MAAVEILDFSFSYPVQTAGSGFQALSQVRMRVESGSFMLLAGMTGSGKSTLMRCLKAELAPMGERSGSIRVFGQELVFDMAVSSRQAADIGYVLQDPEAQIVMDSVWHELAFGLENIGASQHEMQRRIAETASFFGINNWFDRKTADLSGGQKQLLNLASIMVMQPRLLLLDEPTAQLDPLATKEFLTALHRVSQELGVTVMIIEHNLEEVAPLVDEVAFIANRSVAFQGSFQGFIDYCSRCQTEYLPALPAATQLAHLVCPDSRPLPLTVRDGREWLFRRLKERSNLHTEVPADKSPTLGPIPGLSAASASDTEPLLKIHRAWFAYERTVAPVLRDLSLQLKPGGIYGIIGTNGSGKSTLLSLLAGIRKPQRGNVKRLRGLISAALPQDPKALFNQPTLRQELADNGNGGQHSDDRLAYWLERYKLTDMQERHPYDLSGGEQQKAALIKLLLRQPQLLLLDEPTKGLDAFTKADLLGVLRGLAAEGKSIVIVSHDLEFVASVADDCSMLFNGTLVGSGDAREFFAGNLFYTTAIYRITRGLLEGCVRLQDVYPHVS